MGLGYTQNVPGLLSDESSLSNPAHLDPSEKFMEKLRLRNDPLKHLDPASQKTPSNKCFTVVLATCLLRCGIAVGMS